MQVALILDRFDPLHGGLEQWAFQYALWLVRRGHRVHVVARYCAPEMSAQPFVLHALDVDPHWKDFAEAAEQRARSLSVDIVHDLGSGWYFDILQPQFGSRVADFWQNLRILPLGARWRRRFTHSHRHSLKKICAFEKRQYGSSGGRVVAVSRMTHDHLRRFNHVPPERMTVIHNGVDTDRFAPAANSTIREEIRRRHNLDGKIVFLFAAHNFRLKGLSTLLRALRRLQGQPLHALVVGRGEVEVYQGLAAGLGVDKQVTFCDFVDDIRDYYHASDIYVHPTFYDPCSLAVLEAMACGLPVITTRFNGAAEMIHSGVDGVVLPNPASAPDLARAMRRLINPEDRTRMGRAARDAALRQKAENGFNEIFATYLSVLENKQGRDSQAWK